LKPTLIAYGDSWVDLPARGDLVDQFQRKGWNVESAAHYGDTIEGLAYDPGCGVRLARSFQRLSERHIEPSAVVLSAGGNDISGHELGVMLNHSSSGISPLSDSMLTALIDERLQMAYKTIISGINGLSRVFFGKYIPIVVHGYGYVVPDGRGYLGGAWMLPGPWLRPALMRKGYTDLQQGRWIMGQIIDRFNSMVSGLNQHVGMEQVRYVDLREVLKDECYTNVWSDELHPTERGFEFAAKEMLKVLETCR
jgi:hypothetical protein